MKKNELTPTPGTPVATVIFAKPNTIGEKILRHIANPERNRGSMRHPRLFGRWRSGVCEGSVGTGENFISVKLVVGEEKAGIEIREAPGKLQSLKATREGSVYAVKIGASIPDGRVADLANKMVATFVCHGNGWKNRNGEEFDAPYDPIPVQRGREKGNREDCGRGCKERRDTGQGHIFVEAASSASGANDDRLPFSLQRQLSLMLTIVTILHYWGCERVLLSFSTTILTSDEWLVNCTYYENVHELPKDGVVELATLLRSELLNAF